MIKTALLTALAAIVLIFISNQVIGYIGQEYRVFVEIGLLAIGVIAGALIGLRSR